MTLPVMFLRSAHGFIPWSGTSKEEPALAVLVTAEHLSEAELADLRAVAFVQVPLVQMRPAVFLATYDGAFREQVTP